MFLMKIIYIERLNFINLKVKARVKFGINLNGLFYHRLVKLVEPTA